MDAYERLSPSDAPPPPKLPRISAGPPPMAPPKKLKSERDVQQKTDPEGQDDGDFEGPSRKEKYSNAKSEKKKKGAPKKGKKPKKSSASWSKDSAEPAHRIKTGGVKFLICFNTTLFLLTLVVLGLAILSRYAIPLLPGFEAA